MDIHTFISPLISIKLYIYIYHHWSQLLTVHHIDFQFSSQRPQLKNAIFGSKLSFLGLHYIVLQYILIASFASPGKLHAESLFTPPLQRLKHLWLPCAFFCSAPTVWYGMIPVNATANHSCTILSQAQKQALNSVCWKKSGWALTATCSMPFIHSPASA